MSGRRSENESVFWASLQRMTGFWHYIFWGFVMLIVLLVYALFYCKGVTLQLYPDVFGIEWICH